MFLFADGWFQQCTQYRQAWIKGTYGTGKSLLAFASAHELIKRGVCVGGIANIPNGLKPHPWRELIMNTHGDMAARLAKECVFVYDEAGIDNDNRTSLTNSRTYYAFLRKMKAIGFYPSVIPVDRRLAYLRAQRLMKFGVPIISTIIELGVAAINKLRNIDKPGAGRVADVLLKVLTPITWLSENIWVFQWSVMDGEEIISKGVFWLIRPSEYFALYDSSATPIDDGDIAELLTRTIIEERKYDYAKGRWWVYADNTATAIPAIAGTGVGGIGEWQENGSPDNDTGNAGTRFAGRYGAIDTDTDTETDDTESGQETGANTRAARNYRTEVGKIAQPFRDRPNVAYYPPSDDQ